MNNLFKNIRVLSESYLAIILISLVLGALMPKLFFGVSNFATLILQVIFFLSSLKIKLSGMKSYLKDLRDEFVVVIYMLLVLPLAVYAVTIVLAPDLVLPLTLLAAMPAGMSVPLMVEVVGGRVAYGLLLTIITQILSPFTIPFLIYLLFSAQIEVPFLSMIFSLIKIIFIPFILAQVFKKYSTNLVLKFNNYSKSLSILLLGLLLAGIIAKHNQILHANIWLVFRLGLISIIFYILLHLFGYSLTFWQNHKEKLTVMASTTYMNFVLALYLIIVYFPEPKYLLFMIIQIIPWAMSPLIAKNIYAKLK